MTPIAVATLLVLLSSAQRPQIDYFPPYSPPAWPGFRVQPVSPPELWTCVRPNAPDRVPKTVEYLLSGTEFGGPYRWDKWKLVYSGNDAIVATHPDIIVFDGKVLAKAATIVINRQTGEMNINLLDNGNTLLRGACEKKPWPS